MAGEAIARMMRELKDLRCQLKVNTETFLGNLEASIEGVPKTKEELLACLQRSSKDSVIQVVMQYSNYLIKEAKRSSTANKLILKHMKAQMEDLSAATRRRDLDMIEKIKLLSSAHDSIRININSRIERITDAVDCIESKLEEAAKAAQARQSCMQCKRFALDLDHLRRTLDSKIQQEVHLIQSIDYEKKRNERLAREVKESAAKQVKPPTNSVDKSSSASEQLKQALVKIHTIDNVLKETKREYEQKVTHLIDSNSKLQLQIDSLKVKEKFHSISTQHTSTRMPHINAEATTQVTDKSTQTVLQVVQRHRLDAGSIIEKLASQFLQHTAAVDQRCRAMAEKCASVEGQVRRYVAYIMHVTAQNRQMKALQYTLSKEIGNERSRAERFYRDANKYKNEIETSMQAHKEVIRQNDMLNTEIAHLRLSIEKMNKPKNMKKIVQDMNSILLEKDLKIGELEHRLKLKEVEVTATANDNHRQSNKLRAFEDSCSKLVLFVRYLADKYDGKIKSLVFQHTDHLPSYSSTSFEPIYPHIDRWHVH